MIANLILTVILLHCTVVVTFPHVTNAKLLKIADQDGHFMATSGRKEVFVFSTNAGNWKFYDWSKITTIVQFGYHDNDLVKFAHQRNVTVSFAANFNAAILSNTSALKRWTEEQVEWIESKDLDGINIDFEDEVNCSDVAVRSNFVQLLHLLRVQLKSYKQHSQLSIDFAWSPYNIDNRCYDYWALAEPADLVFVMAYDERSQIFGPCIAGANSPYADTIKGVKSFVDVGVPPGKMVLGVPWYGYDYDCALYYPESDLCFMREVPFRGVPCSDAAGSQIGYSAVLSMLNSSSSSTAAQKIKILSKNWDDKSSTPYFSYLDLGTGIHHQVWYDDYISLTLKYSFARSFGLAGVGFWNADGVDYSGPEEEKLAAIEMWDALPV